MPERTNMISFFFYCQYLEKRCLIVHFKLKSSIDFDGTDSFARAFEINLIEKREGSFLGKKAGVNLFSLS